MIETHSRMRATAMGFLAKSLTQKVVMRAVTNGEMYCVGRGYSDVAVCDAQTMPDRPTNEAREQMVAIMAVPNASRPDAKTTD
jgi:hypothetical protein